MVFEEAARLSYQLRQLWPQVSALTPKIPAQFDVSPSNAQTHRLLVQQARPHLSYDQKNALNVTQFLKSRMMFLESVGLRIIWRAKSRTELEWVG